MAVPFRRSLRALAAERRLRPGPMLVLGGLLLLAWLTWFLGAPVRLYEVSEAARIEVAEAGHPVEAREAGTLDRVLVEVGQEVEAGEVLMVLDARDLRLALAEAEASLAALARQRAALAAGVAAGDGARSASEVASVAAAEELLARAEEAEEAALLAESEARRARTLRETGAVAAVELERLEGEARRLRAAAAAARAEGERGTWERRTDAGDRAARQGDLDRELARVEGELVGARAAVERLGEALERRQLRAPVAGRVAELAPVRTGEVVERGAHLGSVVPPGRLHVVAHCDPTRGVGRIAEGQGARMRLDGFPWSQYGSLPLTVARVPLEVRGGQLRVELSIEDASAVSVPLQHGMTGTVEIEVERTRPAALALRLAGRRLTGGAP